MVKINKVLEPYKNLYAASKPSGVQTNQLQRWIDLGALVDSTGQVWIKTSKPIEVFKNGY